MQNELVLAGFLFVSKTDFPKEFINGLAKDIHQK